MSSSTHALVTLLREGAPLEAAADTLVRTYPDESGMPHGSTCPQRGAPADVPFSVVLAHLR